MTSSFVMLRRFLSVSIFAVVAMQLLFINGVLSVNKNNVLNQTNAYLHHICLNSLGKYKSGSLFEKSVNRAINRATENSEDLKYGFYNIGVGDTPNDVNLRLQCRGDLSLSQCRSCLTTSISEIRKRCPKNKGRIIWYDYCVFELSSDYRWSEIDIENNFYLYNAKSVMANKESFNKKVSGLLYKLKEKASEKDQDYQGKNYMYAAGEENLGTRKLYAMTQCMKDLSRKNCSACLNLILAMLPKCCNGKEGGRVLCTSCNFRYELYPFVKPLVKESYL